MRVIASISVALLAITAPAYAKPRIVRIIWNVGQGVACVEPPEELGRVKNWTIDPLVGYLSAECQLNPPDGQSSDRQYAKLVPSSLKGGDYVRVYAVNYNPVSYKPTVGAAIVMKPEDPAPLSMFLGLLRALNYPSINTFSRTPALPHATPDACASLVWTEAKALRCLESASTPLRRLETLFLEWQATWKPTAVAVAKARRDVPGLLRSVSNPAPDSVDANANSDAAWLRGIAGDFSCTEKTGATGLPCDGQGWVQRVAEALGDVFDVVRTFDARFDSLALQGLPASTTATLVERRERLAKALESWLVAFAGTSNGVRSDMSLGIVQLSDDFAALRGFRQALAAASAAERAVELPQQGPVVAMTSVIFTLPLQSQGASGAVATRVLSVEVRATYTRVTASVGAVWNPLSTDLRKLAIEQTPGPPDSTGRPTIVGTLRTAPAGDMRIISPFLATHFRLWPEKLARPRWSRLPYVTVGTLADKNIFKTAVVGASWLVPEWRSALTIGLIRTQSAKENDLVPVVRAFSNSGQIASGLNLAQITSVSPVHWGVILGWTVTPF